MNWLPLVDVEDLRAAIVPKDLVQGLDAESSAHGVGELIGEYLVAVPVDDHSKVHKTEPYRQIVDTTTLDMIGMLRQDCVQKIGIYLM